MLIKLRWIKGAEILVKEEGLRERIKKTQKENKRVIKTVEESKKSGIKSLRNEKQKIGQS